MILLALAACLACAPRRELPVPRHIVLVTIDTLRADHLGYDGYPRATSPFLDRLAGDGYAFRRAVSAMPTTVPAHVSLFTSLYPVQHQVLKNGQVLDEAAVTWAEILREHGFTTAAFVSTSSHFGPGHVSQGFTVFDEPAPSLESYRSGTDTVAAALAYLAAGGLPERLFLWVHLFDPHVPYNEGNRFVIPEAERAGLLDLLLARHPAAADYYGGEDELLATIELYDGEVRAADQAGERLFRTFERQAAGASTLWIVTADHGEGLGGHSWKGHGKHLYNEQIRVPLILYSSPAPLVGSTTELVEHIDLLPSVLDLLGVEPPAGGLAFQGRSLLPYLLGRDTGEPRYALVQRRHYGVESRPSVIPPEGANYEAGHTFALQDPRYKYILRTAGQDELFDLEEDFYETHNLLADRAPQGELLRQRLLARLRELRQQTLPRPTSMSHEELESLRGLGYLQ